MKTWQRGELAMCGFKVRYRTKKDAREAILRLTLEGEQGLELYRCYWCRSFHLGYGRKS